jgi:Secretion system C-terminal sorting domain/Concanavalin A-like lectin/glucanases superfamily
MKKLFTILFLTSCTIANAQNPFAYYPMNGNGNDASGNNKNGVLSQIVPAPDRNNVADAALLFNAANGSEFKVDDTTGFGNGNGSVSIAAWVKCSGQGINSVFTSGMQGFAKGIFMSVGYIFYDGSLAFALAGENGTGSLIFICSKAKYNDDNWHHVAIVVNKESNIATLYIDAKKAKIQNFSGFGQTGKGTLNADSTELDITGLVNSSTPTQAYVGIGTSSGITQNFTGSLDEVYYYKSALSQEQVTALFNGIASGLQKNKSENLFSVYPNPSTGVYHLKNTSGNASLVKVMDLMGKEVKSFTTEGLYDSFDLSELTNGMYLLMIEGGASLKILKN